MLLLKLKHARALGTGDNLCKMADDLIKFWNEGVSMHIEVMADLPCVKRDRYYRYLWTDAARLLRCALRTGTCT